MKKLALTLASLLVVASVASAKEVVAAPVVAPEVAVVCPPTGAGALIEEYVSQGTTDHEEQELAIYKRARTNYKGFRATFVGMEAEWEHEDGSFNSLAFLALAGFKLGDNWTFGMDGAKFYNLKQDSVENEHNVSSSGGRVQVYARRAFNFDNGNKLTLGARYRGYNSSDRWGFQVNSYSIPLGFTTLSGWGLAEYRSMNSASGFGSDSMRFEVMPLNFTVGPVKVGYYYYGGIGMGSSDYEHNRHQARAYFPVYNSGKFTSNMELRYEFKREEKNADGNTVYGFDARTGSGDHIMAYLNLGYDVTEQLNLYAYIGYSINKWDFGPESVDTNHMNGNTTNYSDIGIGWSYAF